MSKVHTYLKTILTENQPAIIPNEHKLLKSNYEYIRYMTLSKDSRELQLFLLRAVQTAKAKCGFTQRNAYYPVRDIRVRDVVPKRKHWYTKG